MAWVVIQDYVVTWMIIIIIVLVAQLFFILGMFKWAGGTMMFRAKLGKNPLIILFRQEGGALIDRLQLGKVGRIMWYKGSPLLRLAGSGDIRPSFSTTNSGHRIATFFSLKNFAIPPEMPLAAAFYDALGFKGGRFELTLLNYFIASRKTKQPARKRITDILTPEELASCATDEDKLALLAEKNAEISSGDSFLDDLEKGRSINVYADKSLYLHAEAVKQANNIGDNEGLKALLEQHLTKIPHLEDVDSLPEWKVPPVYWNEKHGVCLRLAHLQLDWNLIKTWMYTNLRSDIMDADINTGVEERFKYLTGIERYAPAIVAILIGCGGIAVVAIVLKFLGVF